MKYFPRKTLEKGLTQLWVVFFLSSRYGLRQVLQCSILAVSFDTPSDKLNDLPQQYLNHL